MDRQKQKIKNYKSEINDLNAEFETDREFYLGLWATILN